MQIIIGQGSKQIYITLVQLEQPLSKRHKGVDIAEEFGQKSKRLEKKEGKKVFGTGLQKIFKPT